VKRCHGKALTILALSILFAVVPLFAADTKTVVLLGSSDIHGYFLPWDYATDTAYPNGGLTKIATVAKRIRATGVPLVMIDAGDLIQGNFTEKFKADAKNPMVMGLNALDYDLWVPGNHEFDFGSSVLAKALSSFDGKVLGGNVYRTNGARYLPPTAIIERDGIKIGFIGLTTPMIMEFKAGSDLLKEIEIRDPVAEARAAIAELKGKVDAIVGIFHMGEANENNVPATGVKDIIAGAPGLDVVFAGHMHLRVPGNTVSGTLVVEPYVYAQNLSRVDLSFEKTDFGWKLAGKKSELVALATEASDPATEAIYAPYHAALREDANTVIGKAIGGPLVPKDSVKGFPAAQMADSPMVTLFHAACLEYSGADVVAIQIDNFVAKMDEGAIKRKDIAFNYQYAGGEISNYEMTGADLKAYMEWSADYFNTLKPGDVTYSFNPVRRASKYSTNDFFGGVRYTIDLTEGYGKRIKGLMFSDGRHLGPETKLVLGMNSYRLAQLLAKGGIFEGRVFKLIADTKVTYGEDDGIIRALTVRYVKEIKKGIVEALSDDNWKLSGIEPALAREKTIVESLLNSGVIVVPKSGAYGNIASINVVGKVARNETEYASILGEAEIRLATAKDEVSIAAAKMEIELIKALKLF